MARPCQAKMSAPFQIQSLKLQIQELKTEIKDSIAKSAIQDADEYLENIKQRHFLQNLLLVAQNELNSLLHHYRVSVTGVLARTKNDQKRGRLVTGIYSEICISKKIPATLDPPFLKVELLEEIRNEISMLFVDKKYKITHVKQLH